jgi:hypothetical protein
LNYFKVLSKLQKLQTSIQIQRAALEKQTRKKEGGTHTRNNLKKVFLGKKNPFN